MGSCEDSGLTEEPTSSGTVLLEEGLQGRLTCSRAVREDNAEPDRLQGCTWSPCLIRQVSCVGNCEEGDFQEEKVEVNEIAVKDVQSMERETQRNFDEGSEEGEEMRRTVNNDLKCLSWKDSKVVGEPMDDPGCLETCVAGANVDSYGCLAVSEVVEDSPSPMTNNEFAEEQENEPYTSKIAENNCTRPHAAATCSSLQTKQTDHSTDIRLLGGVLIGSEGGIYCRETQLVECAISREVTIDDDFAGDLNEDCCPWSWWENSPDFLCRSVTLASTEDIISNEISASQSREASCLPEIVPIKNGIVYDGSFKRLLESNGHGGFGSHDRLSPSGVSEKLLDEKPVNDIMFCEGRIVEETEDTDNPKGIGPCRPDPIDENSPGVMPKGSLKSGCICRSGRKTQAKMAARSSRNASNELQSQAAPAFAGKGVKKKRTHTSKAARASIWGALNNISLLFEQLKGPESEPIKNCKSKKSGVGRRGKKKRTSAKRNFEMSEKKSASFVTRIRLKVKLGKETIESSLNKEAVNSDLPASFGLREGRNNFNELCLPDSEPRKQFECFGREGYKENFYSDGTSLASCPSTEILETNSFLDKSDGNVTRTYTEISNNVGREAVLDSHLDPETSPDSEVINTVPEVQGGENGEGFSVADLSHSQDITVHENVFDVKGRKINVPSQGLLARQDGSLIMQKSNENIAGLDSGLGSSSLDNPDYSLYPVKSERTSKGQICKSFKPSPKSTKSRQRNQCSKKVDQKWSKEEVKDTKTMELKRDSPSEAGSVLVDGEEQIDSDAGAKYAADTAGETTNYMPSRELVKPHLSPRNAWVRCDDCLQWRRISVALANSIEDTNSSWSCKENMDYNFADCLVPQEKSNAEINAELEISDASGEEDENDGRRNYKQLEYSRPTVLPQSSFVQIHSNKFTHRSRRTQSIDEVMVCHCKSSLDGRLGCGDECLNRVLNIECVQGTCPCGDLCSNQQFRRRKYANMQWFRCGKKGFGLQLLEDVRMGTFIIEYVGEVLDMPTHEARHRDYAAKGHKHFYFMTLNGSEVIDASAKGNLGRFINHSCDPNCRTEKWMVNGEICIGLFAIRDIKKGRYNLSKNATRNLKPWIRKPQARNYHDVSLGAAAIIVKREDRLLKLVWFCVLEGEEVTFDYNFVRVFGAAVKKCFCGSRHCRGYIGGDPLNSEVIVQDDSDDEFPEPEMLNEDGDILDHLDGVTRPRSLDPVSGLDSEEGFKTKHKVKSTIGPRSLNSVHQFSLHSLERTGYVAETKERVESSCLSTESAIISEFATGTVICETQKPNSIYIDASQTTEETHLSFPRMSKDQLSNDASKVLQSDKTDGKRSSPKLLTFVKMSKSSNALCKGKENNVSSISNKVQGTGSKFVMLHTKSRRLVEGSSVGRFEAVEEKLNELLDTEGGIGKRKDAAKGYLKLLFLTAASGDCVNGGAIQSNRDLSMILDALLKTRSRVVLVDILSKNGLQMLHNILKQYRRDFKKIPILRKLLKVVEYLATREILTLEHICSGPPYPGVESFRESMLSLTEHEDKQVHQIARNFRDKYIPKSIRKICHADRAPALLNSWRDHGIRPMEAIDCLSQSVHQSLATPSGSLLHDGTASSIDNSSINGRRIPKRKSRWDQPEDALPDSMSLEHEKNNVGAAPLSLDEPNAIEWKENSSEDIPPGFSPSVDMSQISPNASSAVVEVPQESAQISQGCFPQFVGKLQERYNPRLPVSYGIPCYILQNLGKPQAEAEGWIIAPGMPFHPFPPLPQYPRDKKRSPGVDSQAKDILEERKQPEECCSTATVIDESTPGTGTSSNTANSADENTCSNDQSSLKKPRISSQDLGRKYFKQQKWNTTKVGPPWVWKRKCWGFSVRGGSGSGGIGNSVNGNRSSSFTEN